MEKQDEAKRGRRCLLGCLGGVLGVSWGVRGAPGGVLGESWEPLGCVLGRLGALLGRLGGYRGSSWGVPGRPGGALEASWGPLGAIFFRVQILIVFWDDFGAEKGAPREPFWEPKRTQNRSKI